MAAASASCAAAALLLLIGFLPDIAPASGMDCPAVRPNAFNF